MEKTVKVDRYARCSVVTFERGSDILKFARGLLSAYERYGNVNGAQMLVVERCTEHHGFARMTPRDKKNAKWKSPIVDEVKAKGAAAGK
jgi:hypothetical protein